MKRSEVEQKLKATVADLKVRIEANPLPATGIAFVAGIFVIALRGLLVPLIVLAAIVIAALWFFSDVDPKVS